MKIKTQELVDKTRLGRIEEGEKRDWLYECLLSSLDAEAIKDGQRDGEWEIMLSVNGRLIEPSTLGRLLENVEKHIDEEALILTEKRFGDATERIKELQDQLQETLEEAMEKIRTQFNL